MSDTQMTRRAFTRSVLAAGAAFTIVPRHVLGGAGHTPPSEQLTKAIIGVGGMGRNHIQYPGAKLLAVCDVDQQHLDQTLEILDRDVRGYRDFRDVLARPDIDIVHIATPPHWHGVMSVLAAEAGKDIWCEKPMTRTIGEGAKVVEAVQRNGRIFRLNTWFRFRSNFYGFGTTVKPIKKLVDSGLLGRPLRVYVGESTGFGMRSGWTGLTHVPPEPVPSHFDYDFWLGPAPKKPYFRHRTHLTFRGYWDYDGGGLGDMGQHYLDPVQYILDKDHASPVEIEADTAQQHDDAVSPWRRIRLTYADGDELILGSGHTEQSDLYLEGPQGRLYRGFRCDIPRLQEKLAEFPDPQPQITDFAEAVRNRQKFALNEENGHRSCTLVNLGKIAVRLRRKLRFDPDKQAFIGDEQANRLIQQPMRSPWQI